MLLPITALSGIRILRLLYYVHTQRVHIHYYYGIRSSNHNGDGLLRPNSIIVVYMDPLGY